MNNEWKFIDEKIKEYEAHKTPVPSYEEYERILVENDSIKQIRDELDCTVTQLREDKIDLEEENAQLKELLKECSPYVSRSATSRMTKNSAGHKKDMKLLAKIDEALQ